MNVDGPFDAADAERLGEALLLADAEDPGSLENLRRLLEELLTRHGADEATSAGPVIRECLDLLDDANDSDAIARLVTALEPATRPTATQPSTAPREAQSSADAEDEAPPQKDDLPAAASTVASLADDPELVREFVDRSREHLGEADALLLTLEEDQGDKEALDSVFRLFHTIKGMAGFLAFQDIEEAAHATEDTLDAVRKETQALDREVMDSLFAAVDLLRGLLDQVVVPSAQNDPPLAEARSRPASDCTPALETASEPAAAPSAGVPAPPDAGVSSAPRRVSGSSGGGDGPRRPAAVAAKTRGTVHVDEERLDRLLETIGELVIAEAAVSQSLRALDGGAESATAELTRLDKISRQLQEMATSMRMVTFRTTLRRMARLVRDLSRDSGRPVRCVLEGEEIELDKHVVEGITDSLVHLVRNAVDHGVEPDPEERVRAGKPRTATVRISARHMGGRIVVDVADDGRGIDADAVIERARERGIIGPDETPPAEAIPHLICEPGFSTAEAVTEVSGRGVGMDVVKRTAEALLGSVAVTSTPGEGTTVRMTLPLTLAIIDGMIVRVGNERFIIPALAIVRSQRIEDRDITGVLGQAEMLSTPQGLVPLVRPARLFAANRPCGEVDAADGDDLVTIVSGADGSSLAGLVVSELLGQQQIVMKPLGAGLGDVRGVSGAAILSDGTVGLVIDVQQTVRLAHGRRE